jgi:hypothetical protein
VAGRGRAAERRAAGLVEAIARDARIGAACVVPAMTVRDPAMTVRVGSILVCDAYWFCRKTTVRVWTRGTTRTCTR